MGSSISTRRNKRRSNMLSYIMMVSYLVTKTTAFSFSSSSLPSSTSSISTRREFSGNDVSSVDEFGEEERSGLDSFFWGDIQDLVLRDSLPKFTISTSIGKIETMKKKKQNVAFSSFVLWRNLIEETPELSGYPIDFLQARYKEQQKQDEKVTKRQGLSSKSATTTNPIIQDALPFLDDYEFSNKGGISATVYGLKSVADGSRITTPAVINVRESLPKGYIQTIEFAFFELGTPVGNDERWITSDIPVTKKSLEITADIANNINVPPIISNDADGLLLRLGGTTGIFLAGATAINILSHHMTVNIFWV